MSLLDDTYTYFLNQGYSPNAAGGISAGLYAESGLNAGIVNPSSGAYGIGQWLGGRQQSLFATYGSNPSFYDQLGFVNSELQSGNGGATISGATSPASALSSFINLFERPGKGAETSGDISRGTSALNSLGLGGTPNTITTGAGNLINEALQATGMRGGILGLATGSTGGLPGDATASQMASGLFGPLIDWFNSLIKNFEAGVAGFLERSSFGVIGLILLTAGIFIIVANSKTAQQAGKAIAMVA